MNRIYKSKWNSALGAWVACSETTNRMGKTKSIALASAAMLATSFSFAQGTCGTYTNDAINPTYTCIQQNVGDSTFSANGGLLFASGKSTNVVSVSQDITVGSPSARKPYTNAGVAISPRGWDSATGASNTVSANNVALYLQGSSAGTNAYGGVGAAYGGKVWLNNFTFDVANANNGDMNGLMAGAPYNDKNPNGTNLKNYIHVAGNYNFTAIKSDLTNTNPTTGIRSILNNNGRGPIGGTIAGEYGPQPIVTVDGKYTANITSGYGNGVYVSGKWDQTSWMPIVNLSDTDITITGSGNALKVGKKDRSIPGFVQIRDGWGAGQLNFKDGATVNIDQSQATGEAIAVTYGGSVLNAAGTAAFNVVSQGNSIRVGNDILTNAVQPSTDLISINIANANFRTITPTSSLIRVDPQQQNVALQFTGAKTDLTAPSDGYIIDVQGTGAQFSKASLALDQGASMTGLTNKTSDSTLNIAMANGSTWDLAEKSTGAVATSNFNTLDMSTSSTLNAFKASGSANFVMNGAVNSVSSTISMQNPSGAIAGDNLSINGNYTGTEGALNLDTALGDDASITDKLTVTGNTSGSTEIDVLNAAGAGAMTGAGIKVVQVDGNSASTDFSLKNGAVYAQAPGAQRFEYRLYQGLNGGIPSWFTNLAAIDTNDWYLRSTCVDGSTTTGGSSSGTDALGCRTPDTILVQDSAVVGKVEGAGGADTIRIRGSASVTGDVLGAGSGIDMSAAEDSGDTITINTTGSIGGNVDGGLGDDVISVQAGTVKGSVIGGEGNDTLTVTGTATVAGIIDGGNGNDTMEWSGSSSLGGVQGGAGSDTLTVSSTQYNGSQMLDGGDDTSVADGQIDTLNLNGVTATTNGSTIINWEVIKLNQGTKLTLDGTLTTGSGTDAAGNPMGLAIDSSSTLATGSTATVTGDVANAGTIDLHTHNTNPVNSLTINGNYTGKSGSKLLVDSTWNNANSLTTDSLAINGSASGSTTVSVPGGIFGDVTQAEQAKVSDKPVVTVSNPHAETVFTGSAPTSNAGEAQLLKVGNNYHWTLLAKARPTDPTPTIPIYDEPTSAYVQMPLVNKEMGFAQMGKLHERVGEQQTWAWDDCGTRCKQYQDFKDKDQKKYPVWGRINGEYLKMQGDNRFAFKSKTGFVQFGTDLDKTVNAQDESRRHNGVMLTYGWGSTDFFDKNRAQNGVVVNDKYTGKADTSMLSLGGYSTWYAKNGTYLDLVGNLSWLHNKYRSRDGLSASQNGYGLGLSAEVGRPWRIGESQWQIEPQAQLSYQRIHLNSFNDGVRNVSGQSMDGLRGRIGARLAWNAQGDELRTKSFYLTANLLHDFKGSNASATMGRETVQESYGRTWGEVGLGAQTALSKATYLYGDVRYQRSLDGNKGALGGAQREGYHGRIGVRHTW